MVLNIRHPDGLAAAKRLAERADVLVQNFRPGTLERLGLGYEDAHEAESRPGLLQHIRDSAAPARTATAAASTSSRRA